MIYQIVFFGCIYFYLFIITAITFKLLFLYTNEAFINSCWNLSLYSIIIYLNQLLTRYESPMLHQDYDPPACDCNFSPPPEVLSGVSHLRVSEGLAPQVHRHLRRHTMVDPSAMIYGNRESLDLNRINRVSTVGLEIE